MSGPVITPSIQHRLPVAAGRVIVLLCTRLVVRDAPSQATVKKKPPASPGQAA